MDHKDLEVWKDSIELTKFISRISSGFPKEETFGLMQQIKKSAISVPSSIAEGSARQSIAKELRYLNSNNFDETMSRVEKVRKLLLVLIKYHKRNIHEK